MSKTCPSTTFLKKSFNAVVCESDRPFPTTLRVCHLSSKTDKPMSVLMRSCTFLSLGLACLLGLMH